MAADDSVDERYRGWEREEDEEEQEEPPPDRGGVLSKVPEWVVPLGGGFLLSSTLVTLVGSVVATYLLLTGDYTGLLAPFEQYRPRMWLIEAQFLFATLFQAAGTYFAYQRTHWGTALLACLLGSLVFITIPLTVPAFLLLGLGRYHFALKTPTRKIRGGSPE